MCNNVFRKRSEHQEVKPREKQSVQSHHLGKERLKGRSVSNNLDQHVLSMSCEPRIVWS